MSKEFEIVKEVTLDATPDEVWQTVATEAGLATWFHPSPVDPTSDLVVGWEPGRRLAIQTPQAPDGSTHAFEYLIEGRAGGSTVLRFVHSGMAADDWADEYEDVTAGGWDMYLFTLVQYHMHFAGRAATCIVAEAPPSSSTPDAWPALARALGLQRGVELDAPVRVELPGAEALEGVIDYVSPNFVGFRTADALIRFHGRWGLGLSVAVSHHAYSDINADSMTRAWQAWLAAALSAVGAPSS